MGVPNPYPGLNKITDPVLRDVIKLVHDRLGNLETRVNTSLGTVSKPLADHLDANGKKVTGLATATGDTDAVSLRVMREYVQGAIKLVMP